MINVLPYIIELLDNLYNHNSNLKNFLKLIFQCLHLHILLLLNKYHKLLEILILVNSNLLIELLGQEVNLLLKISKVLHFLTKLMNNLINNNRINNNLSNNHQIILLKNLCNLVKSFLKKNYLKSFHLHKLKIMIILKKSLKCLLNKKKNYKNR